jgi:hypothetical protein
MKAHHHLIDHALKTGNIVSVFVGEEWPVKKSNDRALIIEHIESVEESQIRIYNANGVKVAWALIVPFGVGDDETVADHTLDPFMESWSNSFDNL